MMCTKTKYADFFVWCPRVDDGIFHVERIKKNKVVCETILRDSYKFFVESIIPELSGEYYTSRQVLLDKYISHFFCVFREL